MDENILYTNQQSNEITENITEENQVDNENSQDSTQDSNDIMLTDYYYDYYYQNVLDKLNSIDTHQSEIIVQQNQLLDKQDTIIACHQQQNTYFQLISFLIALIFICSVLRNMIKKV